MPEFDLVNVDSTRSEAESLETETETKRRHAIARARVEMAPATAMKVVENGIEKGDVLGCARIAGIQAAKRAAELIPSALPVMVGGVSVEFEVEVSSIAITARVEAVDRTGVSIEALTCASIAALTIYDMCKAIDRSMTITDVIVEEYGANDVVTWRRGSA